MPIYVYECRECSQVFEAEQRISEEPLSTCQCGGPVKRVIQPVGVAFKGSGFHINDYAGKSAPAPSESPTPEAPKTESTKSAE